MSSYKVIYFNFRGRAESIRFLLSYGGIEFEDVRLEEADWPKYKPLMPFGKVPVLEIDGEKYSHTIAICSYLGEKFNLSGSSDLEKLQIQTAALFIYDLMAISEDVTYYYKDSFGEENFKKELDKFMTEKVPAYLDMFEELVAKNNGYFVNGKLTWADIYFASLADYIQGMFVWTGIKLDEKYEKFFDKYENLKNLRDKVFNIDGIKKWIDERPVTTC